MSARDELLEANARFAAAFAESGLPRPPTRRLAVVTCMDARVDPARALGLSLGDANVIRNAGARVTADVLRSLTVAYRLLGVREALVVGHTDCGLAGVSNAELQARVRAGSGVDASDVDFDAFADLEESVREGVRRIGESPLLEGLAASGWIYDVETGRVRPVPGA